MIKRLLDRLRGRRGGRRYNNDATPPHTVHIHAPHYVGSREELLRELNALARSGRLGSILRQHDR